MEDRGEVKRLWPVILCSALGIAVLCALGAWQLQRLSWKQALLARIEAQAQAAPLPLAEALKAEDKELLKVTAKGRYVEAETRLMIAVLNGNPGWEVVTPLLAGEQKILVDRGLIPDDLRGKLPPVEGEVEVTGVLRSHNEGQGFFSPANDPAANMWFWWDVPAMLGGEGASYVLHLTPRAGGNSYPRPQPTGTGLVNNHLQYAITWFGLALALLVIAGLYVGGQVRKPLL